MDYKVLGQRIKNQRLKLNLTQEKLAEKCDISDSFMGHIERGDRKLSLETLVRIAQALDVSIDYLLMGAISQEPDLILKEILDNIRKKNELQAQLFIKLIKVLFDSIDEWS